MIFPPAPALIIICLGHAARRSTAALLSQHATAAKENASPARFLSAADATSPYFHRPQGDKWMQQEETVRSETRSHLQAYLQHWGLQGRHGPARQRTAADGIGGDGQGIVGCRLVAMLQHEHHAQPQLHGHKQLSQAGDTNKSCITRPYHSTCHDRRENRNPNKPCFLRLLAMHFAYFKGNSETRIICDIWKMRYINKHHSFLKKKRPRACFNCGQR